MCIRDSCSIGLAAVAMLFQTYKTLKYLVARFRGDAKALVLPPQLHPRCSALKLQLNLRRRFAVTQAVIEQLRQHLSQRLLIEGNGCQLSNGWQGAGPES